MLRLDWVGGSVGYGEPLLGGQNVGIREGSAAVASWVREFVVCGLWGPPAAALGGFTMC